jgi:hypothetical protein
MITCAPKVGGFAKFCPWRPLAATVVPDQKILCLTFKMIARIRIHFSPK